MPDKRFVVDTNVLVSATLFPDSKPGLAFKKALKTGDILLSDEVIAEYSAVLLNKKFNSYLSIAERQHLLNKVCIIGVSIKISETIAVCRDPKDDKYLSLAKSGLASCLISGDNDLLVLNPFEGIPIINPSAFLDKF